MDTRVSYCPIPEEGIWFYASLRSLAVWMGEGNQGNVSRAIKGLADAGLVRKIFEGDMFERKGTAYLIPTSLLPSSTEQHRRGTQSPPPPITIDIQEDPIQKDILIEEDTLVSLICCSTEGTSCTSLMCRHREDVLNPYLDLQWTRIANNGGPGLNHNQKLLVELLYFGDSKSLDESSSLLGTRKDNLRKRVVNPLVGMGIVELDEEGKVGVRQDIERTMRGLCAVSGGDEARKKAQESFEEDREKRVELTNRISSASKSEVGIPKPNGEGWMWPRVSISR